MTFPTPDEYWTQWPMSESVLAFWPREFESASDRNAFINYLESLRDEENLVNVDFDPYAFGYLMLDEPERRQWMGAFFQHLNKRPLDSLFSEQVFQSFEVPPWFDPHHTVFMSDKKIYDSYERQLILRFMKVGYETAYKDDIWRYRDETLDYWSSL